MRCLGRARGAVLPLVLLGALLANCSGDDDDPGGPTEQATQAETEEATTPVESASPAAPPGGTLSRNYLDAVDALVQDLSGQHAECTALGSYKVGWHGIDTFEECALALVRLIEGLHGIDPPDACRDLHDALILRAAGLATVEDRVISHVFVSADREPQFLAAASACGL